MSIKQHISQITFIVSIFVLSSTLSVTNAEAYSPYPGKLAAKLVAVRSASIIDVSAETWPGFTRTFSISLAGIEVPTKSPDAKLCQRKLAEKALSFTEKFLTNAKKIEIQNMTMQTSADQNAEADIFTEKGSLGKALKSHGFARIKDKENQQPWC